MTNAKPWFPAVALVLMAFAQGCSCSNPTPVRPDCDALGVPGCGAACDTDSLCGAGLYCDDGVCGADCTSTGNQCPPNEMCSSSGQCVPSGVTDIGPRTDFGPRPDFGPPVDLGPCVNETVMADRVVPNVVVLVDQSGSMDQDFGTNPCSGGTPPAECGTTCSTNADCPADFTCTSGGCRGVPNRWDAVRDAILGARITNLPGGRDVSTGLFPSLGNRINFVLSLYTARSNSGSASIPPCTDGICNTTGTFPDDATATCPQIVNFPISGGLSALAAAYETETWADETPTGASVNHVVRRIVPTLPDEDTFIILATDGEPDTCAQPNPQEGQEESLVAVEAAFTASIPTFVIGVGISSGHFQELANVGQGLARNAPEATQAQFFTANDVTALNTALANILRDRISCDVTLNGSVPPESAALGTVILEAPSGNLELPLDASMTGNGWILLTPTTIRLNGTACDTWKDGESELDISFPCGTIIFE